MLVEWGRASSSSSVVDLCDRGLEVNRDEMICFCPAAAGLDEVEVDAAGCPPVALSSYVSSSYSSLSSFSNLNFLAAGADDGRGAADGVGRARGAVEVDAVGTAAGRGAGFLTSGPRLAFLLALALG